MLAQNLRGSLGREVGRRAIGNDRLQLFPQQLGDRFRPRRRFVRQQDFRRVQAAEFVEQGFRRTSLDDELAGG